MTVFKENAFTILDGALGTMLQQNGLTPGQMPEQMLFSAPDTVTAIHRAYVNAGADIVCANTFGANRLKLAGSALNVYDIVHAAIACAKKACQHSRARVALDVGPLGEMLEPGGTLTFEAAYDAFAEMMRAGEEAGADLILIETMTDLYEAKAALLAAVENTALPALVSMSFEENGRTFSGTPVEAMALTLAPLGAAALGINCSLGPIQILPLIKRLLAACPIPVFVKPNAGLPDPISGAFSLSAKDFAAQMQRYLPTGVSALGGCCGTTPQAIALIKQGFLGHKPVKNSYKAHSMLCSGTRVIEIAPGTCVGERINPTGKKRLQAALKSGDMGYVQQQAAAQKADGAQVLDINVGMPGIDEKAVLPLVVKAVQQVCDLPLVLDSADPIALEAALRVYCGKALINSTTGEEARLNSILPLCKKYGAAVVGLTLDDNGIPPSAQGRIAIAQKILNRALALNMPREDVVIDCLTLAVASGEYAAAQTLAALGHVKHQMGLKTLLGVSNISFGLPMRALVNTQFLTLALGAGLDMAIVNPATTEMMDALYAFKLLNGQDESARDFLARFAARKQETAPAPVKSCATLRLAIEQGLKDEAAQQARALLGTGMDGMLIVTEQLMPALDAVGLAFEQGHVFLPQLLSCAGAAQAAFEVIRTAIGPNTPQGAPVVVATVQGDIHDIGKNIVKTLLENYGFYVIDLGRDVPPERVVEAVRTSGAHLVGLSALMTTTLPSMEKTILALREANLPCRIVVGGAVLTQTYADAIGADYYAKDAQRTVQIAREVLG